MFGSQVCGSRKSLPFLCLLWIRFRDCGALSTHIALSNLPQGLLPLHAESTNAEDPTDTHELQWTMEELDDQAEKSGVILSWSTFGPGYRAVARAKHDESLVMGYVEGFVRPAGEILHLDKMEVWKKMVKRARNEAPAMDFGGFAAGIGLLLGYRCLLHGIEKGCTTAEFLAIDDEEFQHKRLVRYYKQFGFQVVKYVGEDIQDIPDRLVWGGCGTLMREDIQVLQKGFSSKLSLMRKRQKLKEENPSAIKASE
eukprot:scaffold4157_cov136-Cylindrotheca_fusiformis.AAC.19